MWHASIALLDGAGVPKPITGMRAMTFAKAYVRSLLRHVGQRPDRWDFGELVVHLRRAVNDEEIGRLSAEWLAIPAVDMAGEGGVLPRLR